MADVTVTITTSLVSYKAWLTTSYIGTSQVSPDGKPLVINNEMGPDQEDAFLNLIDEAAREVLKAFVTRQGNVTGIPFEKTTVNVIYRFKEETPVLPQALAIKEVLTEDVKNALFCYVTFLWMTMKGNKDQASFYLEKYQKTVIDITGSLYQLHD